MAKPAMWSVGCPSGSGWQAFHHCAIWFMTGLVEDCNGWNRLIGMTLLGQVARQDSRICELAWSRGLQKHMPFHPTLRWAQCQGSYYSVNPEAVVLVGGAWRPYLAHVNLSETCHMTNKRGTWSERYNRSCGTIRGKAMKDIHCMLAA